MLRNGGNDTLILNLVKDLNFATQVSRPAVLYINGEYMGIYVLQEKFSDKYLADHYKVDKKNVILIEEGEIDEGEDSDIAFYEEMRSYADKDLSDAQTYDEFCSIVDIDSMIDYYATEIYIGNNDWDPLKNTRLWRVRTPENEDHGDGRWRWILYDTEFSASMYNFAETRYDYNSFAAAQEKDPLFASVIKNPDFYEKFSEKIRSLAENNFTPDKVNAEIDRLAEIYKPYMPNYYKRFGDTSWAWDSNINGIKDFFEKRFPFIRDHIQNYQP